MELLLIMFLLMMVFVCSGQPMIMVVSLMGVTCIFSIYLYTCVGSYWFSYALMLVVLSGVMVVFVYMASLAPNESFEIFNMISVWGIVLLVLSYVKAGIVDVSEWVSLKLWGSWMLGMMMYLVTFLLCIMVMVVWLSDLSGGAVRVV